MQATATIVTSPSTARATEDVPGRRAFPRPRTASTSLVIRNHGLAFVRNGEGNVYPTFENRIAGVKQYGIDRRERAEPRRDQPVRLTKCQNL